MKPLLAVLKMKNNKSLKHTCLLQRDDHCAGAERVPRRAVVGGQEVRLHYVVDGEGGEDAAALG